MVRILNERTKSKIPLIRELLVFKAFQEVKRNVFNTTSPWMTEIDLSP